MTSEDIIRQFDGKQVRSVWVEGQEDGISASSTLWGR